LIDWLVGWFMADIPGDCLNLFVCGLKLTQLITTNERFFVFISSFSGSNRGHQQHNCKVHELPSHPWTVQGVWRQSQASDDFASALNGVFFIFSLPTFVALVHSMPLYQTIPEGKTRVFMRKPVKRFEVQIQTLNDNVPEPDSSKWGVKATVDISELTAEVTDLLPGVGYHVRICSLNTEGRGACSPSALYRTADGELRVFV
jgi:hypothetical protein